jgi:hypothetical protein
LCNSQASPHTICIPMYPVIPRSHASMDHRYNSLPFSIQNSNSYSLTSQTFMLQGSHMGPPPVMPWEGSPVAGQHPTWPLPSSDGYWPPPPSSGYCPPLPPASHPGQSSNTPPPPFSYRYWSSPPWAPPAGGQVPPWGMPPWTTSMPQPQRHSSSPQTVSHSCLLSIVPFII